MTICEVWKYYKFFKSKIEECAKSQDSFFRSLADSTNFALEKKQFKYLSKIHKIAVLLNPASKKMLRFSAFEREEVKFKIFLKFWLTCKLKC